MILTFVVNQSIDKVFEYLTDMKKFVSVHPVISKIDKLSERKYLVHETLKLGFIPFSFTYPVEIDKNVSDKTIIMIATIMKMVKIEIKYDLSMDKNSTIINETIIFKSILPVTLIMEKIFTKQHSLLFEKINNLTQ